MDYDDTYDEENTKDLYHLLHDMFEYNPMMFLDPTPDKAMGKPKLRLIQGGKDNDDTTAEELQNEVSRQNIAASVAEGFLLT